jgi:predicted 3-demethylubiquinone-9 3-methyltransferase (glyoxalase superfamily)
MATKKRRATRRPAARSAAAVPAISPCLWFEGNAEEAARYYVSIFKKSKMGKITRYPAVGQETHGQAAGKVMTVEFRLNGVDFLGLNGGPLFKFNEAVSFQVFCRDQKEVDYYWEKLGAGGDPNARQCGWLKDKYGLSWQVVPLAMIRMLGKKGPGMERAFAAMMDMKKLDIAALERAFKGK